MGLVLRGHFLLDPVDLVLNFDGAHLYSLRDLLGNRPRTLVVFVQLWLQIPYFDFINFIGYWGSDAV